MVHALSSRKRPASAAIAAPPEADHCPSAPQRRARVTPTLPALQQGGLVTLSPGRTEVGCLRRGEVGVIREIQACTPQELLEAGGLMFGCTVKVKGPRGQLWWFAESDLMPVPNRPAAEAEGDMHCDDADPSYVCPFGDLLCAATPCGASFFDADEYDSHCQMHTANYFM